MFQSLRANNQLFILHKDANPYIEYGPVVSVSAPRPKLPMSPAFPAPQMEMVVDIVVSINGQNTCSRDAMNNEIMAMKQKSTDILNSMDMHRSIISGCDKMINSLNPEFAEKQRQDAEIKILREQVSQMSESVNTLMELLKGDKTSINPKK